MAAIRGGEAAQGEAAVGGWAEAGSSGVAAWLVHTGACSIGVLMRRTEKDNKSRGPLHMGAVATAEAGWVEGTIHTVNRAGSSRRRDPRLRKRDLLALQEGRVQTIERITAIFQAWQDSLPPPPHHFCVFLIFLSQYVL